MNDERLPELFESASELDEAGRRELLARLRTDSPELAAELERLLETPNDEASPVDDPPWRGGSAAEVPPFPERVGDYRLIREVGRGGMGRVFLAERQTPDFRRRVALKLIDGPAADDEAIRRFRDEVRILASLDHPGIVRFLDGGRSPEGVWFLALEYVEGEHLLAHAERHALPVARRVELFRDVLAAVAYAHRAGVVHRDIKPANLLVGVDGRPRLLDFGISKLLDPESTADSVTERSGRRLTPAYASPEQLDGRPVTAASDVFSLGVVLYELLTGRRPYAAGSSPSRQPEPEPPSHLSSGSASPSGPGPLARRPFAGLRKSSFERALDRVCLHALRPEPADRPPDALAFAAEVGLIADGEASDPAGERQRRRLGIALVAGALLVATAAPWWARHLSQQLAPTASSSGAARTFPFDPVNPPALHEAEQAFLRRPADSVAGATWVVRLVREGRLDEAGIAVARLRQLPEGADGGLVDFAEAQLAQARGQEQRALALFTRALERAVAAQRGEYVGTFRMARGALLEQLGDREGGVGELERASDELRRAGDSRPLYRALCDLAVGHLRSGRLERGEALLTEAVAVATTAGFEPVVAWTNLAQLHLVKGRPELAEPIAASLVEYRRRRGGADTGRLADALARHAAVLRDLGREREADPILAESLGMLRGSTHPDYLAGALFERALADLDEGRLAGVSALVDELARVGESSRRRRPLGYSRVVEARRAALSGDLASARRRFAEARELFGAEGDDDLAAQSDLAWAEAELAHGAPDRARRLVDDTRRRLDAAIPTQASFYASTLGIRIDAGSSKLEAARDELERLGEEPANAASLSRRLAFLAARAALAAAERRGDDASGDLTRAIELARSHGRKLPELDFRLARARLTGAPASEIDTLEREARSLGLLALAGRARSNAP